MRKILFAVLILFGLSINAYSIWPTDEVISDIFSPNAHAIFVIAIPTNTYDVHGSTIFITTSQLNNILSAIEASSKAITQGLTDVKPVKLYEGQTVYKSSGTAGKITSATGTTITVSDKVRAFYFLYESPTGEYCNIEPSTWGVPIPLSDGKYTNVPVDYPEAITFTVSNMVVGSTLTWVVPTCK